MVSDHRNFIKAGGIDAKRTEYGLPYPEKVVQELTEDTASEPEPIVELPDKPGIDADLDAEFVETPEERNRRQEWIRYYVREKDLPRAYDLGWDGKPFKQANFLSSTASGIRPKDGVDEDEMSDAESVSDEKPSGPAQASVEAADSGQAAAAAGGARQAPAAAGGSAALHRI